MNKPLKRLTFLHVLLFTLGASLLIHFADFRVTIAQAATKSEKVDVKTADPATPPASAAAVPATDVGVQPAAAADAEKTVITSSANEPPADDLSNADIGVLQQLSNRRRQLDDREKQLTQREALLKAAQTELQTKYQELDKLRGELKALLDQQSTAEEARLTSLVKVYEGMKPSDAANIFNTLDMNVLMPLMGRMSERKMSPILAGMNPDRAREVTMRLAQQKKLPDIVEPPVQPQQAPASVPQVPADPNAATNVPPKP